MAVLFGLLAGLTACSTSVSVSPACDDAMVAAEHETGESESAILATLDECENAEDWIVGLQAHPTAGSFTSYTRAEAINLLDIACIRRIDAVVCIDAAEQGHLSFELDDPRLPELQVPRP
ncbi:hypothetical protein HWD99_12170 [Microbacterium sp. C5A9]|uniref:hypothetical protein n=1 Tax=Microbacterium sp. C5A9 TaxID=2736663 RepID=UPI001F5286B9|nr:hypothetical protein [Microbacterium sp. C5A9]MCI1019383.1 hypothetical protein [Microbacterium sp. C5A9]